MKSKLFIGTDLPVSLFAISLIMQLSRGLKEILIDRDIHPNLYTDSKENIFIFAYKGEIPEGAKAIITDHASPNANIVCYCTQDAKSAAGLVGYLGKTHAGNQSDFEVLQSFIEGIEFWCER